MRRWSSWAGLNNEKCRFVMVKDREWQRIEAELS